MFPTLSFGNEEFTPQEMSARSAQVAGAMTAIGLNEGDTIALMLRNEPALMDVMLAARQLGLYFTPLNWHFKSDEAAYIMRDCGAKALFTHTDLYQQIREGILSSETKCNSPADLISAVDQDLREVLPCDAIRICRMTKENRLVWPKL